MSKLETMTFMPADRVTLPTAADEPGDEQSDGEVEEWLPSVLKRWEAVENAKQYTAFLRFAFEVYGIPARAYSRRNSRKYLVLQVVYAGQTRTMQEMREKFHEVWDLIYAFPRPCGLGYNCNIKYYPLRVWEQCPHNGLAYARMVMCVGKGTMPYLPPELRDAICSS